MLLSEQTRALWFCRALFYWKNARVDPSKLRAISENYCRLDVEIDETHRLNENLECDRALKRLLFCSFGHAQRA
jgi:hypothetical protein